MITNAPSISIITVVYNSRNDIEKTILSIQKQTFKELEYIVIDGGSTDGTIDIIHQYENVIDNWISEPDKGLYDAMNKGILLSKGKFLWFINAGDEIFEDTTLEKLFAIDCFASDIYYGETALIDENGNILGSRSQLSNRELPEKLNWKSLQIGMVVQHQSIIVRKEIAPLYNLNYKVAADIDWVINGLKNTTKIVNSRLFLSKFLTTMFLGNNHGGGFSSQHYKRALKERFNIFTKHYGLVNTLYNHSYIFLKAVKKYLRNITPFSC
jgi:glycosyltransferase involved in cell wall biosynthesis